MNDNKNKLFFEAKVCSRCNNDIQFSSTCICSKVVYNDKTFMPVKFGEEKNTDFSDIERCNDCNVIKGAFHHNWCEAEECPKCGNPMLICKCPFG